MNKSKYFTIISLILILTSALNFSQTVHLVEASNFVFTPANITVQVGDTVRWKNINGNHNVVADDGSFTSGAPSTDMWVYDHVFTEPGDNPYYCQVHGGPGGNGMSGNVTVISPTGVTDKELLITNFKLEQNYPNPFNPSTKISWQSSVSGRQILKVYDILGNEVSTLLDAVKPAGEYQVEFDGSNLPSGIYLYQLQIGSYTVTKKMTILK